jgi:hypothetical protein
VFVEVVFPLILLLAIPLLLALCAHLIARESYPRDWKSWEEDDSARNPERAMNRLMGRGWTGGHG